MCLLRSKHRHSETDWAVAIASLVVIWHLFFASLLIRSLLLVHRIPYTVERIFKTGRNHQVWCMREISCDADTSISGSVGGHCYWSQHLAGQRMMRVCSCNLMHMKVEGIACASFTVRIFCSKVTSRHSWFFLCCSSCHFVRHCQCEELKTMEPHPQHRYSPQKRNSSIGGGLLATSLSWYTTHHS